MYQITADLTKNCLFIRLEGTIDPELDRIVEFTLAETRKLQPGFTVINDISRMKAASQEGVEKIKLAQAELLKMGPEKIIRITENPITKMQFDRTGKSLGYTALEVKTMEEALVLAEKSQ